MSSIHVSAFTAYGNPSVGMASSATGTVNLTSWGKAPPWVNRSEAHRNACHLGPSREGSGAGLALIRGVAVGGAAEEVGHLILD